MATIKDVAERAGLSVGTVSRILNNRGYISEASRRKVELAMNELNYQPNELARALSKQTTNLIGLIVPHIRHPYFAAVISDVEMEASRQGYRLLLFNTRDGGERQQEYVEQCRRNRVDGIILCSSSLTDEKSLADLHVPIIAMERYFETATACVECDNYTGGKLAANYLIDHGRKNLVIISGGSNETMPADDRTLGFVSVCRERGVDCREVRTTLEEYNAGDYYERLHGLLEDFHETQHPVDGLFASSDLIAAQFLQVARADGIHVPQDVGLIGFDDTMIASLTNPTLTTIHQPITEMAQAAVKLLIDASKGRVVPMRTILPVRLVERDSTMFECDR